MAVIPSDSSKSVTRSVVSCCQFPVPGEGIGYNKPAFFLWFDFHQLVYQIGSHILSNITQQAAPPKNSLNVVHSSDVHAHVSNYWNIVAFFL